VTSKGNSVSVHLADYPEQNTEYINSVLEEKMELAQVISSLIHSIRKKHKIKVRQPLSKILLPRFNDQFATNVKEVEEIILNEVNVKEIEFVSDDSGILVKRTKPNFRSLGQKHGALTKNIATVIGGLTLDEITQFEEKGMIDIEVDGQTVSLGTEDIEISYEDIPGWSVASEGRVTVALDITITDELKQEGLARDFVNRIQNLRKSMGLEVQDKIKISVKKNSEQVERALDAYNQYICRETQANALALEDEIDNPELMDIDQHQLAVKVNRE